MVNPPDRIMPLLRFLSSMKVSKTKHIVNMAIQCLPLIYNLWYWLRYFMVRYFQNSIDLGTVLFYLFIDNCMRLTAVVGRCSHLACPSTTVAPTLLPTTLLAPIIQFFPIHQWLDTIDRPISLPVALPHEVVSKKRAPRDLVAADRSLPLLRGQHSI